ncbi:unnamed protein product [Diabrotica balteata]|uniref:Uncharacterized protein n=1 Tax=Diabrotica balteata TaxID=107213 RepID=A0A9N9SRR0_DIABA|nr:unnamed protein product [Diabrotica balteata]
MGFMGIVLKEALEVLLNFYPWHKYVQEEAKSTLDRMLQDQTHIIVKDSPSKTILENLDWKTWPPVMATLPDTVPQGSVDMCKVLEVTGAEQVTGHPHSLALTSPDRVTFVKAASREDARWWAELLAVFPRRHKRNATFPGGRASPSLPQLGRSASPQPPRPRHLSVTGPSPRTNFETPPLKEERESPPKEQDAKVQIVQPSSDFLGDNAQKCINSILLSSDISDEVIYAVNLNFTFQVPVIYYNTKHNFTRILYNKPSTFIMAGNVSEALENLYNQTLLNSRAKFIILVAKISPMIYKILDDYNIYKVLVIIKSTMQMFVYQTSKKGNYQMMPLTLTCSALRINDLTTGTTEISTLKTMYSFLPPGVVNQKKGVYIEIVNTIMLNMNVTMDYVKTEGYDAFFVPSQFKTDKCDFFISPISEHMIQTDVLLDKTSTVNTDVALFLVPRISKPKNRWNIFYEEFSLVVWLCCFAVAFVLYLLFMYFSKRVEINENVAMYIAMISILFEGCTNLHIKSVGLRALLVNYLIFCLILTTVYKSRMFDIMIRDIPSEIFEHSQDIWKYPNFRMCLPSAAVFYIFNASVYPPYRELTKNNRSFVDKAKNCLEKVAKDKNKVSYLLLSHIEYYVPDFYLDEDGKSLVNTFELDQMSAFLCLCFREGHPLFPAFNSKLRRLKASGIINHIILKSSSKYRKAEALANAKDLLQYNALNVDHLRSTFLVYLFGMMFSVIAFCLEYFRII